MSIWTWIWIKCLDKYLTVVAQETFLITIIHYFLWCHSIFSLISGSFPLRPIIFSSDSYAGVILAGSLRIPAILRHLCSFFLYPVHHLLFSSFNLFIYFPASSESISKCILHITDSTFHPDKPDFTTSSEYFDDLTTVLVSWQFLIILYSCLFISTHSPGNFLLLLV